MNTGLSGKFFRLLCIVHYTLFIVHGSFAQIGSWQSHVSYRSGQSVAVVGNYVYAASRNGLFQYNKSSNETLTLDKSSGLSDAGISRLCYLADQKRLLISYQNGNLDFLTLSETGTPVSVKNLNTIRSSTSLPASRSINHINRLGNNAYLSTDFGLVVLDVSKDEIRDTYFTSTSNSSVPVYATATTADSLYALILVAGPSVTSFRLIASRLSSSVNIADPANWRTVNLPISTTVSITSDQNKLLVSASKVGVYERRNGSWILVQSLANAIIRQFPTTNGQILATEQVVSLPGSGSFTGPLLTDPREVAADGNRVWVADAQNGLLLGNAGTFEQIVPEGPQQDRFANLYAFPGSLVALTNSPADTTVITPAQSPVEIFSVPDQRWSGNTNSGITRGFNSAAYLPSEQTLYLGSFGQGLWRQTAGQPITVVTLPAAIGSFITSLAADAVGNVWIAAANPTAKQATLHVRRADGQMQSLTGIYQGTILQIVPDDNGFLWIRRNGSGGILVIDPQTNRSRSLGTATGQGGLLSSTVLALAKDRTGSIWIGTDAGPMVIDNTYDAIDGKIDAQSPIINRRRLLANEAVTAIAVDGGNRKWLGTQSGLYHVAPDGSQLLDTFTADSSPLPSDLIQALAIEPISGTVFFETGSLSRPYGLSSYRGPATEPSQVLNNLTIFPNPVRPDFTGTVGINGLTENATVKILDAGGQLVFEAKSQGGTATWNLRDYRGRQAQTGIYLVVVVAADGSAGLAGKLAVVR
ncbi:type IX secretion system anionic LPS delivery protein PorZ [Spirosoma koreense]